MNFIHTAQNHTLAAIGDNNNLFSLPSHGTDFLSSLMDDNQCHEVNHDEAHIGQHSSYLHTAHELFLPCNLDRAAFNILIATH